MATGSSDASLNSSPTFKPSLRTAFSKSLTDISQKLKSIKIKDLFRRKTASVKDEDVKKHSLIRKEESKATLKGLAPYIYHLNEIYIL